MQKKKCKGCKSVDNIPNFIRNYKERQTCNKCADRKKTTHKIYYENSKDYKHAYYIANKDKISARHRTKEWRTQNNIARRRHRIENMPNFLLYWAKQRAKAKNIQFDLTVTDIVIPVNCPILGIKLEIGKGKMHANSPSLDRIIPELGYVRGNVCVISYRANSIKKDASLKELEALVCYVKNASQGE